MAEAFAVVGALSSFLQVIEFTAKVASHAREILDTSEEALHQNEQTKRLIKHYKDIGLMSAVNSGFAGTPAALQTEQERKITTLGTQTEAESDKLLEKLEGLSIDPNSKGFKRVSEAAHKAVKHVTKRKELEQAQKRVQEINGQLATVMLQEILARQKAFAEPSVHALAAARSKSGDDVEKTIAFLHECRGLKQKADRLIGRLHFPETTSRQDAIDQAYPRTYQWALGSEELPLRLWFSEHLLDHGEGWLGQVHLNEVPVRASADNRSPRLLPSLRRAQAHPIRSV